MNFRSKLPKYLAEAAGTFCLVFAGTAAVVVNQITGGQVSVVGIGLVFGLVVLAMVYAVGHISGAHLNPAVTLGFFFSRRLPLAEVFPYVLFQSAGALAASGVVFLLFFGTPHNLGATLPAGSPWQSFGMEFILTLMLMFVIMGVATDHRAQGIMAGVAIGATIGLEAILGGPVSGASMNPARSLAPAIVSGQFDSLWIYLTAPFLGSMAGAFLYRAVQCVPASSSRDASGCC